MKCPKCNYVSHDYLDVCRKCGRDLGAFKQEIGLLVLQPGMLDLNLVLGGAGTDNLFESVEEEVAMHSSDDDDFDISLDDYSDHPAVRRTPAGASRTGGRAPEDDMSGLDHLTLELDASALPAELTARLRAAQALPDPSPPPRPAAAPPTSSAAAGLPGHVTLEFDPDTLSTELPSGVLRDLAGLAPPPAPFAPEIPETPSAQDNLHTLRLDALETPPEQDDSGTLRLNMSGLDLAPTAPPGSPAEPSARAAYDDEPEAEHDDDAIAMADFSGVMASLPLQDVVLAEDMPAAPETQASEGAELTIPTIELLDLDAEAETHTAPPELAEAVSPTLHSLELSVDDALFVSLVDELSHSDLVAGVEPAPSPMDAPRPEEVSLLPSFDLEPETPASASDATLRDLPVPTLDEAAFTFMDEDALPLLPAHELTASPGETTPAETLTSSDMFALEDLEDATLPGHLTLEMQIPELPDDLSASLFEEAQPTSPQEDTATLGATSSAGSAQDFTHSDALALGDLDDLAMPGHLTLELDPSELVGDVSSSSVDDLQLDNPPGDVQSKTSPPHNQAHDEEEELLLDLDDFEFDDDKRK